ncbi:MAG TPA: GNAT family N-acetyltransferase [Devosia sp.]|nr:GNAT family N-acetyltransferase [Devosia sp.]
MSATSYAVEREENEAGGRYVVRLAPGEEGEMTFRKRGADTIVIDHTGVPRAFRSKGIARLLVDRMIEDARAEGTKIVPLCSYVVAQFARHPEWRDLLAG